MSAVYQSTVGDMSVNCRWHIGQLSVAYQSYVICIGQLLADTSVKYRPIIGEVSAKCRRGIGDLKAISADIHIDRLSTDYRPTIHRVSTECRSTVDRVSIDSRSSVDRVSIECRPSVDRVSTATSTDIAVDIAVDTTYSKHDPRTLLSKLHKTLSATHKMTVKQSLQVLNVDWQFCSLISGDFAVFFRFDLFFLSFRVLVYILLNVTNFLRNERSVYIFDGDKTMPIFAKNKICMQINAF